MRAKGLDCVLQGSAAQVRADRSCGSDFANHPEAEIERSYERFGLALSGTAMDAMIDCLAARPKGSLGEHVYDAGQREAIAVERDRFRRYQQAFGFPDEV